MDDENKVLDKITPVTIVENLPVRSQDLNMIYNTPYKYNIMNLNFLSEYSYIAPYSPLARSANTSIIIDYICNNINDIIHYFINTLCGDLVRASEESSIAEETRDYMMGYFSTISIFDHNHNIYDRLHKCIYMDIERLLNYVYELPDMDREKEINVAMSLLKPKLFSTILGVIDEWIIYYVNSAIDIMYFENQDGVRINIRMLYSVIYEFCNNTKLDQNTADITIADQYQFCACMIRELLGMYQKDIITALDGVIATATNMILYNQKPDAEDVKFLVNNNEEESDDDQTITIELEDENNVR